MSHSSPSDKNAQAQQRQDRERKEQAFDLDTYIGRYAAGSETRVERLAFIAQHASTARLKQAALDMLKRQLMESHNVVRFHQIFCKDDGTTDAAWIRQTTAANEANLEVLEARLSAAQANLNKDAIRNAHLNLGDYMLQRGHAREALKSMMRSRDYCTSRSQTGHICWKVIQVAMILSNYNQVRDYVTKAEHSVVAAASTASRGGGGTRSATAHAASASGEHLSEFSRKLKVAAGIALLADGKYKEAAKMLEKVKVPPDGDDMNVLASPEDVALYSSLLALATMDRDELAQYLEHQPNMLELVPAVRDALRHYVRAEYRQCLDVCRTLGWELDLHLASHAPKLFEMIRNRSLVHYLQPYRRVHLPHMARIFGDDDDDDDDDNGNDSQHDTTQQLIETLADLIGKGEIRHARIDCRTQTLERPSVEMEEGARLIQTRQRVRRMQESVLNDAHASMVRLACLDHESATRTSSISSTAAARHDPSNLAPEQVAAGGFAFYGAGNPEDVFAGGGIGSSDEDDTDDDDVDMVYDSFANPEDAL